MNEKITRTWLSVSLPDVIWGFYIFTAIIFLYYQRVIAIVNIPTMVHYLWPLGICLAISALAIYLVKKLSYKALSAVLFVVVMLISLYWFVTLMETPAGSEDITEGTFLDRFWVHPIILSLYFGISIPMLRSWVGHVLHIKEGRGDGPKEIYFFIGIFAVGVGNLAKLTPLWALLFAFIATLALGGIIALVSIRYLKTGVPDPKPKSTSDLPLHKGNFLLTLGTIVSNGALGWIWLAIISYNGFKFENLAPFGWGILYYYIWKELSIKFKRKPNVMLEGIFAMALIISGSAIMWWLHLNWIHLQLVLFPIGLAGFIFGVLFNQNLQILSGNGHTGTTTEKEKVKTQYNWPVLVIVLNFLVLNFMNLMYLVYRVGYYGTVDFIVFRYGILFGIISLIINGIFYMINKRA